MDELVNTTTATVLRKSAHLSERMHDDDSPESKVLLHIYYSIYIILYVYTTLYISVVLLYIYQHTYQRACMTMIPTIVRYSHICIYKNTNVYTYIHIHIQGDWWCGGVCDGWHWHHRAPYLDHFQAHQLSHGVCLCVSVCAVHRQVQAYFLRLLCVCVCVCVCDIVCLYLCISICSM